MVDFFKIMLDQKAKIDGIQTRDINKLLQLNIAKKCGLLIPETLITEYGRDARKFLKNKNVITKSIQVPFSLVDKKNVYDLMTFNLNPSDLKGKKIFFLSKIQEKIEKEFELRIFYLNGTFYPMAIFSQNNPKTKLDFRNYDRVNPNRNVPFKLPRLIQNKLRLFMKEINLKSGSIDMIVAKNGAYNFLEVNPVGQYGMVSIPCNYFLDKIICEELI